MAIHASEAGIEEDEVIGFYFVRCACGERIGPAPDHETVVDMAMDHVRVAVTMELQKEGG